RQQRFGGNRIWFRLMGPLLGRDENNSLASQRFAYCSDDRRSAVAVNFQLVRPHEADDRFLGRFGRNLKSSKKHTANFKTIKRSPTGRSKASGYGCQCTGTTNSDRANSAAAGWSEHRTANAGVGDRGSGVAGHWCQKLACYYEGDSVVLCVCRYAAPLAC